ncbi:O-methyltransferase [Massilia sp. IC2-476]|uniref:O-methyltransferase n=1 Tax=Massilia sp. IC2-476 TaxID=2887199 RepID=UPI001D0FD9B9|nr:O-methyltransferase [Massilia sp. IC2-476]MCC2972670.1 hypothetical protein [Massilia sp. IC2-476]
MSASFKKIDYSLRPAKHAERRMLCDVFRQLAPFGRVEDYVYVGFGSIWFSDFILMHRALGVKNMISIEQQTTAEQRIEENKPFRIPVRYQQSKDALPELDWSVNQFIWLDYDDPLSTDMLLDMRLVSSRAKSGTVLAVSVQCSRAPQAAEADRDGSISAINRFVNTFGRDRVPDETKSDQLIGWPFGSLSREMLYQEINNELASRNGTQNDDPFIFRPVCAIEYEDGAKMTTLVGIFHTKADQGLADECHFDRLDFIRPGGQPVRIVVPKLTVREFKRLESQLPLPDGSALELGTIPEGDARHFVNMYRYLPSFAVLES